MEKKVMLVFIFLMFFSFYVTADSINNYNVKTPVPLGQDATAYGLFQDTDANIHGNVLCSFYLLDVNTVLIDRADDQYTDSLGYVMSKFTITEPDFKRDSTYVFRTTCGGASMDGNFFIGQREGIGFTGNQEFDYLTTAENTDTVFIWGVFILIFLAVIFAGFKLWNLARGK